MPDIASSRTRVFSCRAMHFGLNPRGHLRFGTDRCVRIQMIINSIAGGSRWPVRSRRGPSMWPSSLRPASPDLPGVGIDHQRHVGKPPPRRHTVRSATHSRFGAGSPNRCWTRSAGRTAAGSAIVVLRVLPRVAPDRPSSAISRSTVQRATAIPSRLSANHTPCGHRRPRSWRRGLARSRS